MLIIDLIIAGIVIAGAVWGYREGLSPTAFALTGFAAGAILGSRVAPLILDGGNRDPFAPAVSLPAALLFGALLAAGLERVGYQLRLRIRRRTRVDALGGAILAACVGVVAVWVVGAAAAQVDDLKPTVRDSSIIEELNATLPPPGPLLTPAKRRTDPLPTLVGPDPNVGPADPSIRNDPQVRAARRSVVKLIVNSCGNEGAATGWVAGGGMVVTNAHVVKGSQDNEVKVQIGGQGDLHDADTIFFDELNDIAVLRAPGVEGLPKLTLQLRPKPAAYVAALGYPEAGPFRITPGRMGATVRRPEEDRSITVMRSAGARPGSSGAPVVDRRGRVVTTHWGARADRRVQYGVPVRFIRRALRRAAGPVATGLCLGG